MIEDKNNISIMIIQILFVASFIGTIIAVIFVCCGKKAKKRPPKKGFDYDNEYEPEPVGQETYGYCNTEYGRETEDGTVYPEGGEEEEVPEDVPATGTGYESVEGQGMSQVQKSPKSKQSKWSIAKSKSPKSPKSKTPKSKKYETAGQKELAEQLYKKDVSAHNDPTMGKVSRAIKASINSKITAKEVEAEKYRTMADVKQSMKGTQRPPASGKKTKTPKKGGKLAQKKMKTVIKASKTTFEEEIEEEPEEDYSEEEEPVPVPKKMKILKIVPKKLTKLTKKAKGRSPRRIRGKRRR